jgi:hypothetical protein
MHIFALKSKIHTLFSKENLSNIIKEELSPVFTQENINHILNVAIRIPLFTTHPSSHQIFKMARIQIQKPFTFGYMH